MHRAEGGRPTIRPTVRPRETFRASILYSTDSAAQHFVFRHRMTRIMNDSPLYRSLKAWLQLGIQLAGEHCSDASKSTERRAHDVLETRFPSWLLMSADGSCRCVGDGGWKTDDACRLAAGMTALWGHFGKQTIEAFRRTLTSCVSRYIGL